MPPSSSEGPPQADLSFALSDDALFADDKRFVLESAEHPPEESSSSASSGVCPETTVCGKHVGWRGPSAGEAGERGGCRGETPRTPPAAGEVAHAPPPAAGPPEGAGAAGQGARGACWS